MFQNDTVEARPIHDYVHWFLDPKNSNYNNVQLPPLQRNAVWNIRQVEMLWDSILRGFPIGSFLLGKSQNIQSSITLTSKELKGKPSNVYFLLDGQQRTRALMLGYSPNPNARLWIDLAGPKHLGADRLLDRKFVFRVVTNSHPWGMQRKDPKEKLGEYMKREARKFFGLGNLHYDYQIKAIAEDESEASWPADSFFPVPFDKLLKACTGKDGQFQRPHWQQILEMVPKAKTDGTDQEPAHFNQVLDALELLIGSSENSNSNRKIVLLLNPEHLTNEIIITEEEDGPDELEILFERVNAGGTRLEGEEMNYSLLKAKWDGAYTMVQDVISDSEVGSLMAPTGFIMAASRLAKTARSGEELSPNVRTFRRWLSRSGSNEFLTKLQELEQKPAGTNLQTPLFQMILKRFSQLAQYKPANGLGDIGLPKDLLLQIHPLLFHPVLTWIYYSKPYEEEAFTAENRQAVLRYLMYCVIVRPDPKKAASKAIAVVYDKTTATFPDAEIYAELAGEFGQVPTPEEILGLDPRLDDAGFPDGSLRGQESLFGGEDEPLRPFRSCFWWRRELLLWFQRDMLSNWFTGYNPTGGDHDLRPYDFDHIVPYSHLYGQGSELNIGLDKEGKEKFFHFRPPFLNSIGNYRVWPNWANRHDQATCHTIKFYTDGAIIDEETQRELKCATAAEIQAASAISHDEISVWMQAGGSRKNWPQTRCRAWQQAVESRVRRLFKELYEQLGYQAWQ